MFLAFLLEICYSESGEAPAKGVQMSDKFLKNEEQRIKRLSCQMEKYQIKQIRYYLKTVRFRINRKRRRLIYGLSLAVVLYLSSIWQIREKILSVREKKVIEYEIGQWANNAESETEGKAVKTTKIRFHINTGELEIVHERTDIEK